MKKIILLMLFTFLFTANISFALPNPAAVYCKQMGYNYNIIKTPQGEYGECVFPDKSKCDEWEFLKGKCGQSYSYCIKNGYDIKTVSDGKNPYSYDYAVCVPKAGEKEIPLTEFITINSDLFVNETTEAHTTQAPTFTTSETLPSYFDWRNNNGNWMTPAKNQGGCGSCWDFAAIGAVEGDANIEYNDFNLDKDLSEQDILSCSRAGSCNGGGSGGALTYIKNTGVVDEPCFIYTATDQPCSNKCSNWQSRVFKIGNSHVLSYNNDNDVKNYLINKGPIVTYLYMSGAHFYNGILRCDYAYSPDHAVVLVGYNDTGGYWILKNSWGSDWLDDTPYYDDGYFKLAYGNCSLRPNWYVDTIPERVPPHAITDLAVTKITGTTATLNWSASGDDGMEGNSSYYKIAYSTNSINETNFDTEVKLTFYESLPSGTRISVKAYELYFETTYYFAIKAYDDFDNPSDISNIVSNTTKTGIVLFNDNIENGDVGWNKSFIVSWDEAFRENDPVLWHITEHKSTSSTHSWYYGIEGEIGGIEGQWNYDTGSANNGTLISPIIDIANYSNIYLILKYSADLEPRTPIRGEQDDFSGTTITDSQHDGGTPGGGGSWIYFYNRSTNGEFIKGTFRLSDWEKTLRIVFKFNTVDELYNDYEGIYLDDIKIIADNHKPVAVAGGPYVNEIGRSITVDGSGSYDLDDDLLDYTWSFTEGDTIYYKNGKIVTYTYANPGVYNITLTVRDGMYAYSESQTTVTISITDSCSDSDGGLDYKVKGTVSGYLQNIYYSNTDECTESNYLKEYKCTGRFWNYAIYNCKNYGSYRCSDGACKPIPGGCSRCFMTAIGPYIMNIDTTPLISAVSAILFLFEIAVLITIFNKLKHSKKKK